MAEMDTAKGSEMKLYVAVWAGLLAIAAIEVAMTYQGLGTRALLAVLLVLAVSEAVIGLLFFMHLNYDRRILFWSFTLSVSFVLLMMNQIWPDAYRMISIGHR